MLSMHNIQNAKQAATYFSKDDYYLDKEQREPSAWWGKGAKTLGLSGEVDRDVFFNLLSGELPNGAKLPVGRPVETGADNAQKLRRPGLDLTFSAPKSVSLLALVGQFPAVAAAHDKAVKQALTFVEATTAQVRTTRNNETVFEQTDNFVVARFAHDTSRKQDPQLHTHCVVMNMTQRKDGQWRALSNEEIYKSKMAAGVVYRAALARNLKDIGYSIRRTHEDGRFEVGGFSDAQLEHFSQRRAEIKAALESSHVPDAKAAARVTLMTRTAKREVDREALGTAWRERANDAGIAFAPPVKQVREEAGALAPLVDEALAYAVEHLSERTTGFIEKDILRAGLPHRLGDVTARDLVKALRRDASLGRILRVPVPAGVEEPRMRKYTTNKALALEYNILECVRAGQQCCTPVLTNEQFDGREVGEIQLTEGQLAASRLILTTRDQFVGVQGYAGTGKSTLLREIKAVAEAKGFAIKGFTPSAAAAKVLHKQSGIESITMARHLLDVPAQTEQPAKPELWVVDEMSMVGNKDTLRLLKKAHRANARVVLLGDKQQLPSIEAGKAFALLQSQGMQTAHMKQIVRQKDERLRTAVTHMVEAQPGASLGLLQPDIREIGDYAKRIATVALEYVALEKAQREEIVVLTPARADGRAITEAIRHGLAEKGELSADAVTTQIFVAADFTHAQLRESASYAANDYVRFGRTYKRLGIEGGEYFRVAARDTDTNTVMLSSANGRTVAWQPHRADKAEVYRPQTRTLAVGDLIRWTRNYAAEGWSNGDRGRVIHIDPETREAQVQIGKEVRNVDLERYGHWDHGYVVTAYGAQGGTWREAMIHIDTRRQNLVGLESWYVSISRAWERVKIYTNKTSDLPQAITRSMAKESALELTRPHLAMPDAARAPPTRSFSRELAR